jgi:serine/threonine protein kinase
MYPLEVQDSLAELSQHYDHFQENNRGVNGYLFFAQNLVSQQEVAIKYYSGEPGREHDEPRQLAAINSPNVLPIHDARSISPDWGYFITPKCNEGDLDDLIESSPSVHVAIDTAIGVCRGLSAIHAQRMLHRDLKPGNIVIDQGRPRIADFGSVKFVPAGEDSIQASRHSILYRPPESFESNRYTVIGDLYQVGLITFQLLGGALPYDGFHYFNARELREYSSINDAVDRSIFINSVIQNRAQGGNLANLSSLPPWISAVAKRSLRKIINPNPARRIRSVAEIAAILTQLRSNINNWKWVGNVAQMTQGNRLIEIRPNGTVYQAFHQRNGQFRRIPNLSPAPLQELVARIK